MSLSCENELRNSLIKNGEWLIDEIEVVALSLVLEEEEQLGERFCCECWAAKVEEHKLKIYGTAMKHLYRFEIMMALTNDNHLVIATLPANVEIMNMGVGKSVQYPYDPSLNVSEHLHEEGGVLFVKDIALARLPEVPPFPDSKLVSATSYRYTKPALYLDRRGCGMFLVRRGAPIYVFTDPEDGDDVPNNNENVSSFQRRSLCAYFGGDVIGFGLTFGKDALGATFIKSFPEITETYEVTEVTKEVKKHHYNLTGLPKKAMIGGEENNRCDRQSSYQSCIL